MKPHIQISIAEQSLSVYQGEALLHRYTVSTAKNGPDEKMNSGGTPRGKHGIRAKIGAHAPLGAIFVGRRATGEVFTTELMEANPERDWILTRILWLSGREPGRNRLGQVDTQRRFIYIHGSPDEDSLGTAVSHGCIRMSNTDVIELFDSVPVGTPVEIKE